MMTTAREAFDKWVEGVRINDQPMTANDREYPIALAAFYSAWHSKDR